MIITVTKEEIQLAVIEFLYRRGMKPVKGKVEELRFTYRKDDNTVISSDLEVELIDKEEAGK